MREREYILEGIEFKGKAYRRNSRKILKGSKYGLLILPLWMIGEEFDIILIPKDEKKHQIVS